MEKKLSSRQVFNGRIVSVRVDQVETATGRVTTREIVDRADTVSVLALDEAGRVLMVRQWRYAVGQETLEITAGSVDPGETPEQAARRELREETGYDCQTLIELNSYYPAMGYSSERMTIFLATGLVRSPLKGDEDDIRLERMPFDEVFEKVVHGSGFFMDPKSNMAVLLARARGLA